MQNTVLRGFTLYSAIIEYHVEEVHEKQMVPYPEFILFGRRYELLFSGNILRKGGEVAHWAVELKEVALHHFEEF